jgi:predicted nucleotidyltransferase
VKTVTADVLEEATRRLAQEFQPEGIWLFGSHAWGAPDEGSDVDLFVVVPESGEPEPLQRFVPCWLRGPAWETAEAVAASRRRESPR